MRGREKGGEVDVTEVGIVSMLLTPNNPLKSTSGPIMEGRGGEERGGARRGGEGRGKEEERLLLADVMLSTNSLTGTISPACGVVWSRSSFIDCHMMQGAESTNPFM